MTLRKLPEAPRAELLPRLRSEIQPEALARWNPGIVAAAKDDKNTISIFDPIGADWMGEGVTSKRIHAALRSIGGDDVTIYINSPGGDVFEGLSIYNLLRDYKGKITVKVMGIAASAASVIAMAGDEIQVARAGFMMIHNCWAAAVGDRNDFREFADFLEPFDSTLVDIYCARTGIEDKKIAKMMDAETFIGGNDCVEQGFADALLPADAVEESARAESTAEIAARRLDVILARSGVSRSERRKMVNEIRTGKPSAAEPSTPSATAEGGELTPEQTADIEVALLSLALTANLTPSHGVAHI